MNEEAKKIIDQLGLEPLPQEGGWFRRTWLSAETLPSGRAAGGAIYFLVTPTGFSALHRLKTEEVWLFHAGDALDHVMFGSETGTVSVNRLGDDVLAGEVPQLVVPGGMWQGAHLAAGGTRGWALLSCLMAPAWEEQEFELGDRTRLLAEFSSARTQIEALTR
ncbi:MAG: cupin domain-containing protein [Verrucomicrobia bacterium]|nr:cupin domain-containing protein [Verrucomicrobiota bacterium]